MGRVQAIPGLLLLVMASAGCAHKAVPDSDEARSMVEQGRSAARSGNHQMAVELFTRAVMEDPDLAEAYNERGKSNVQLRLTPGDRVMDSRVYEQRALDDFTAAVQKNPSYGDAYYNRAMVLASRAEYKLAAEDLLNAARYNARDPETHRWLGEIYELKLEDRLPAAMEHYEKYLDFGGTDLTIREKVRVWKETRKRTGMVPPTPAKLPTPEEERAAGELHARVLELLSQPDKTEGVKSLQTLLATYGHTRFVQERMGALQALLTAFSKPGGVHK